MKIQTSEIGTSVNMKVVFYPNSDKIGMIVHGESSTFYKENTNVDYYEGE